MSELINQTTINTAMSYSSYLAFIKSRHEDGKCTDDHIDEDYLNYTKMSISRMDRLDRKAILLPETIQKINAITTPQVWLTLSEGWCADAAQSLPYFKKMSDLNSLIKFKVILREQNLDIMDKHQTNGTRSIPKVIVLRSNDLSVTGEWGPRPVAAQQIVEKAKADKVGITDAAIKAVIDYEKNKALQIWYKKDKGASMQAEFLKVL